MCSLEERVPWIFRANHSDKVQYLLRCQRWYIARLLQLSPCTSSVDQHRGDENTASSPLARTGSKIEARKQFRKFIFTRSGAVFSLESYTSWAGLKGLLLARTMQLRQYRDVLNIAWCALTTFLSIRTQQTHCVYLLCVHITIYRSTLRHQSCSVCVHKCWFAVTFFLCQGPKGIPW